MLLYGIIIYFMVFLLIFEVKRRTINKVNNKIEPNGRFEKNVALITLLFMWFLTAFRGSVIGNDTAIYIRYFERINSFGTDPDYSIEMGFQWLIYLIGRFTDNPHYFLIIMASILYLLLGWIIINYSEDYLISVFMAFFLCYGAFCNIIRQSLAMMICLIAYIRLKKGKKVQFAIIVLGASIFHISALIVLLLLLYPVIPKSRKFILLTSMGAVLLSGTSFLLNVSHILGDEYTGYFNGKYANSGQLGTALLLIRCVLVYLIIRNAVNKDGDLASQDFRLMYASSFFMIFFLCCGFTVNLISRIADYFIMTNIIDLPIAHRTGGKKNGQLFLLLFTYAILHFLAIQIYRPEWNHINPYEFWK